MIIYCTLNVNCELKLGKTRNSVFVLMLLFIANEFELDTDNCSLEPSLNKIIFLCGLALRFALLRTYVSTSWNLVCATPWWVLRCCKFYKSYGTLSVYLKNHHYQHSIRWCVFIWEHLKWLHNYSSWQRIVYGRHPCSMDTFLVINEVYQRKENWISNK